MRLKNLIFISSLIVQVLIMPIPIFSQTESASTPLYVGVLEHRHSTWPDWFPDKNPKFQHKVRLLFVKKGNEWISMDQLGPLAYPKEIDWFIAFDSKCLGSFKSKGPEGLSEYSWTFSRDAFYRPYSDQSLPVIGKPSDEFSGWISGAYTRPLVVVSQKNFKDPRLWKPSKLPGEIIRKGISSFRSTFISIDNCEQEPPYKSVSQVYKDKDILILKSYHSIASEYLISLQLNHRLNKCDAISEAESAWSLTWFYINRLGESRHIGGSMLLVDAGDYDNDGKSEVIFWFSGYNRDGYRLFYDNFTKSVEFCWSYH
jgi:hypothetical protein